MLSTPSLFLGRGGEGRLHWVFVAAGGPIAEHRLSSGGMWARFCSCPHGPWWLTVQPEEEGGKGEDEVLNFPGR